MRRITFEAPAHWASYLINGDASGLEKGEAERADAYVQGHAPRSRINVVDVDADSVGFTWSFDLYGGDCAGGEIARYTALSASIYSGRPTRCTFKLNIAQGDFYPVYRRCQRDSGHGPGHTFTQDGVTHCAKDAASRTITYTRTGKAQVHA